jgi:hypothetical protein
MRSWTHLYAQGVYQSAAQVYSATHPAAHWKRPGTLASARDADADAALLDALSAEAEEDSEEDKETL